MSTTNGSSSNDTLYGIYGNNNTINGREGDDTLFDNSYGTDTLNGGSGHDNLTSNNGGYDTLNGGTGNDSLSMESLYGGGTLNGGDDNDTLSVNGESSFTLNGGNGNDTLVLGYSSTGVLNGDAGDDILNASNTDSYYGQITLNGGSGRDTIYASAGSTWIDGGTGNDTIYASTNSNMFGEAPRSTQILRTNSNQDTVKNYSIYNTYYDGLVSNHIIRVDDGITSSALTFIFSGSDLIIKIKETTASVRIENFLSIAQKYLINPDEYYNNLDSVSAIMFGDGSYISVSDVLSHYKPETIKGDELDNTLSGQEFNDIIFGLQGNDILSGLGGNDIIDGGSGNDIVSGGQGNDTLRGYTGNDDIKGGDGNDSLTGGAGDDILEGGAGSDLLDGGTGNDTYITPMDQEYDLYSVDTYVFGKDSGQDQLIISKNNYYNAYQTLEQTRIKIKSDVLMSDIKTSFIGSDLVISIIGTTSSLTIKDYLNTVNYNGNPYGDFLLFEDGTAVSLESLTQNVHILGTDADDLILARNYSYQSILTMSGGLGDDTLYGYHNDDIINGDAGNDIIDGGYGNDTINGGSGNDKMVISDGDDTYLFGKSSGQDTLSSAHPYYYSYSTFTIQLDANINISDVTLNINGDHLIIGIKNSTATLTIENIQSYLYSHYSAGTQNFVTDVHGNGLSFSDVTKMIITSGTEFDDDLHVFNNYSNHIQGLGGNDTIYGGSTTDLLDGGQGNDDLYGYEGDDILMGGDGNDLLEGGDHNDTLRGGNGHDTLVGGNGHDLLNGYKGNDFLVGGQGSDTYSFMLKDGHDEIIDYGSSTDVDTIQLNDQLASQVIITRDNWGDLRIGSLGGGFSVTVQGQFYEFADTPIEQVVFADGQIFDQATLLSLASQGATTGHDVIVADANHDTIFGNTGDDNITGNANDNILAGESGQDVLSGGAGEDSLYGGDGSDKLKGGHGDDWLSGETGRDYLMGETGNDFLNGDSGQDKLEGGLDNDILNGGTSVDTYVFNIGDGQDLVIDADTGTAAAELRFGAGIKSTDLTFARQENQLIIQINNMGDQLTIKDFFEAAPNIGIINFADGTSIGTDALLTLTHTLVNQGNTGSDYANYLFATTASTTLTGLNGNDLLVGHVGNDWLDGGAGDDLLFGGAGTNGYQFGRNSGHDTVLNRYALVDIGMMHDSAQPTYENSQDYIALEADIKIDQLWLTRLDNDLIIKVLGSDSDMTLSDFFSSTEWMDSGDLNVMDQIIAGDYQALNLHSYETLNLIQAMSTLTPPAAGQTQLSGEARTLLTPLLAAAWN